MTVSRWEVVPGVLSPLSPLSRPHDCNNVSLASNRLSSLTIGDSDRRSSGAQHPSADLPAESTGNDRGGVVVHALLNGANGQHVPVPGPGLIQRCVVVQKDQLGFGFTVCGERVKLVQNVRPGGAAVKAGVQEGDRIIKVTLLSQLPSLTGVFLFFRPADELLLSFSR